MAADLPLPPSQLDLSNPEHEHEPETIQWESSLSLSKAWWSSKLARLQCTGRMAHLLWCQDIALKWIIASVSGHSSHFVNMPTLTIDSLKVVVDHSVIHVNSLKQASQWIQDIPRLKVVVA